MKTYLWDKYKPRSLPQLKEGIRTYWSKLTPEVCTKYIDHLQKVLPIVVKEEGTTKLGILECSGDCLTNGFDSCARSTT